MHNDSPDRFALLARDLPFEVDDYERAREVYARWREDGDVRDRDVADLWAYLYAYRYFYTRFMTERTGGASDLDAAVSNAYRRIGKAFESVNDPDRFPQYVSVLCRNVLLSHRKRRRDVVELPAGLVADPSPLGSHDRALIRSLMTRAIAALPESVAEIARLKYLEGVEYDDIADRTGHPVATVRTYAARARGRIREYPGLRALNAEILNDDGGVGASVRSTSD
ncbi:RNA polymerase sigma factor [Rubrivirga sp.]|uniref:RNA polymerase sigma factor n=1 Tax=Rubrivirga sp. TaxID=1885344 RepID=UPI003C7752C4